MITVSQGQPPVVTLAHGGSASEIETFLRGLGYNDQLDLLVWLCQTDPELAARGVGKLVEWHATTAERRKRRNKEKYREKRRQRRREEDQAACSS